MNKLSARKKSILPYINKKKQMKIYCDKNLEIKKELQDSDGELFDNFGDIILNDSIKNSGKESPKPVHFQFLTDATVDTIVDYPLTETYECDYKENRRENRKLKVEV